MDLRFLKEGQAFTLYAAMQGDELTEFLAKLEMHNSAAHDQIMRRLDQLAERGASRKKTEFNDLAPDIYEAKAKSGPRVIFFYDKNHIVICSHGFNKQGNKTPKKEIEKAIARRKAYFDAKASKQPFTIHLDDGRAAPRRQP